MTCKFVRRLCSLAALLFSLHGFATELAVTVKPPATPPAEAGKPAATEAAFATKLVGALEHGDYPAFVADGDAAFQQFKQPEFDKIVAQLSPVLKTGYELVYLGDMKRKGFHITLWRVQFKDGRDDLLATLSVKEGKVGGFFIR
jgi:hypothetical protein